MTPAGSWQGDHYGLTITTATPCRTCGHLGPEHGRRRLACEAQGCTCARYVKPVAFRLGHQ